MHIAGGIVLAMFVFAILGLVDSPQDHREPVQRVQWGGREVAR